MAGVLGRRLFLGGAAAGCALPALGLGRPAWSATIPPTGQIPFNVFRNGDSPMGFHRLSFRREGGDLVMEKEISFKVKLAFITAYRYHHANREVWRDGRLVSLDTKTNDDGQDFQVRGRATGDGFAVEGSGGSFTAPADIISTSYWNAAIIRAAQLLDTQRGLLMDVRVDPVGAERVRAGGAEVDARRYAINILTNKPGSTDAIQVWYDGNDAWVKLAFKAQGQDIHYTLDPAGLVPPATASRT